MNAHRDEKGRFVSARALELIKKAEAIQDIAAEKAEQLQAEAAEQATALNSQADALIQAETNAPEWLKALVVSVATHLGITSEEFSERVRVHHPTPADPVLLVDGKAIVAWV